MPFSGCATRCIFCDQVHQTGTPEGNITLRLDLLNDELSSRREKSIPSIELAFYGGTFTASPLALQRQCLEYANRWVCEGLISSIRCSTRPDAVEKTHLQMLADYGVSTIELGIQSFSTSVLEASRRGYTSSVAEDACLRVKDAGFHLGIQLMPGLPASTEKTDREDIAIAGTLGPSFVRLYPCLVFDGTPLAALWRQKNFTPLALDAAVRLCAEGSLLLWSKGIPIIRYGVVTGAEGKTRILAGPYHDCFGTRVKAHALQFYIEQLIAQQTGDATICTAHSANGWRLSAPKRYQGEFFGYKNELERAYAAMGLSKEHIVFGINDSFTLSADIHPD